MEEKNRVEKSRQRESEVPRLEEEEVEEEG